MATRKKKTKKSNSASEYEAANVVNEPPVDIWGRLIETGASILSNVGTGEVYRVGRVTVYGEGAGFEFIGLHDERGHQAGTHVNWEIVARPGQTPPKRDKIRRDSDGCPILGPSNGLPRQLPETACRVH